MSSNKKFSLRLKPASSHGRLSNPNNKAEAAVCRRKITSKEAQLKEAVAWCQERKVCGHSAMKSGLFPLIEHRKTIDDGLRL